ncbi:MAG: SGNH/GDSL hydrolase family protein [Firmicutes bacterium]|nr:SGNH/GDSL hydrolase family protein [Bacillota bacterium]
MQLQGLKANFLGDSITFGHGLADRSDVFWSLLAARDGVIARGYGISGTRIARQQPGGPPEKAKYDVHFVTRVPDMDPDADLVVVFGGTNDYGHGNAPIGRPEDRDDTTFYGALHCLYLALLSRYPNASIVVMTPLHRLNEHSAWNEWGVRNVGCLEDYVNAIQETAAYYGIPVLDLYRLSGMQPENPLQRELYMPDGLHPNKAGQERIYHLLRSFLLSM